MAVRNKLITFALQNEGIMKKILLILCVACLGFSCQNEEEPEIKPKNDYTLFIKNVTHGEILVESKQLTEPMFTLDADKVSELLYSSSEEIGLMWFGKGT